MFAKNDRGYRLNAIKKRFFIALSLYPLSFFANTPFNKILTSKYNKPYNGESIVLLAEE